MYILHNNTYKNVYHLSEYTVNGIHNCCKNNKQLVLLCSRAVVQTRRMRLQNSPQVIGERVQVMEHSP